MSSLWIPSELQTPLQSGQMPSLKAATTGWPSNPSGLSTAQAGEWESLEGSSVSRRLLDMRC